MKLELKNITLLSYNCLNPIESIKALLYSSKDIDFAETILVSNKKPDRLPEQIKFAQYDGKTHEDSSKFSHSLLSWKRKSQCGSIKRTLSTIFG